MSLIDELTTAQSTKKNGSKTIIHGSAGIGKSTWANGIPCKKMLYLDLENGASNLEFDQSTKIRLSKLSYNDVIDILKDIKDFNNQGFTTIVIDSLTKFEQLVYDVVCRTRDNPVSFIEEIAYGKGYAEARNYFINIIKLINEITEKGINIVMIGHSKNEIQRNPMGEDFNFTDLSIHKSIKEILVPEVDCIAYMTMNFSVTTNKKVSSTGTRVLKVDSNMAYLSKNRKGITEIVQVTDYKNIL